MKRIKCNTRPVNITGSLLIKGFSFLLQCVALSALAERELVSQMWWRHILAAQKSAVSVSQTLSYQGGTVSLICRNIEKKLVYL